VHILWSAGLFISTHTSCFSRFPPLQLNISSKIYFNVISLAATPMDIHPKSAHLFDLTPTLCLGWFPAEFHT
jgi:hypothetical protein